MSALLTKKSLDFLKDLANNNDRNWFNDNKSRFQEAQNEFKLFMEEVREGLGQKDSIEEMKVYRIYRDVRFSKNKAPYKSYLSASMSRAGKHRRGGYYFSFEPGNHFVGGGFWAPEPQDLKYIRDGILREEETYRSLIQSEHITQYFNGVEGDALKTAPKGYDKDHPAIELIRNKQYLLSRTFEDKAVLSAGFKDELVEAFSRMIPYFDFMSEVLVFDENGIER